MRSTWNPKHDSDLARRAADGEAAAWDELIRLYGRKIFNLAFQFAGNTAEAEDLTQEIFMKLYRNLDKYHGKVPLVAWALTLSKNLCIERYRRARLEARSRRVPEAILEQVPGSDDPHARTQRRQRLRAVYGALEEMNQDMATAVLLRDLQGWSYEEVAAFQDVPMGTLKSRLARARRELAERVAARLVPTMVDGSAPLDGAVLAEA